MIAVALTACKGSKSEPIEEGAIRLSTDRVIQTGAIGDAEDGQEATYVLVDAENVTDHDLQVGLGGTLDGRPLQREWLRIPTHGRRTFVLVDLHHETIPGAHDAQISVVGAAPPSVRTSARLENPHLFDDHGRVMIAANLVNDAAVGGTIMVLAAFHDADGRPMQRQFSVQQIGSKVTQVVRFTGPLGSKTAYVFLGDQVY